MSGCVLYGDYQTQYCALNPYRAFRALPRADLGALQSGVQGQWQYSELHPTQGFWFLGSGFRVSPAVNSSLNTTNAGPQIGAGFGAEVYKFHTT